MKAISKWMLEVFRLCLLWAVLALGKGFPSFLFFFPNLKHRSLEDPLLSICITTGGKNLRHKTFLGRRINRLCQFEQAMEFRTIISVMLLVKWVQCGETHNQNACDRPRKIFKGVSFANNVDFFFRKVGSSWHLPVCEDAALPLWLRGIY